MRKMQQHKARQTMLMRHSEPVHDSLTLGQSLAPNILGPGLQQAPHVLGS